MTSGEIKRDQGRPLERASEIISGEIRGDQERSGQIKGDQGRSGEIRRDQERSRKTWEIEGTQGIQEIMGDQLSQMRSGEIDDLGDGR